MKVCTDACVFGAWADVEKAMRILDIGTGTGLLSLMVAQRNEEAGIEGVEIEEGAFRQTQYNFSESPFAGRLTVHRSAVQDFLPPAPFDCIVTNPPFYQNSLKSPDAKANLAHHSDSLSFADLLAASDRLLETGGRCSVLLPFEESLVFEKLHVPSYWYLTRELVLAHRPGLSPFRRMMTFRKGIPPVTAVGEVNRELLYIYEENGKNYDSAFKAYLKAYYLGF
ncbi:methyltransferase [Ravibacter arvi]|uniref:tRNA1(Val) (adenine(37)-N6)-methyltransferase n=2 Tax=Ravibacter arvi TaxID=2051041 RepID=A0ABP8LVN8_9BACT